MKNLNLTSSNKYKKEDLAYPTLSIDWVFITGAIKAWEEQVVACFGIPGAFLHADCEEGDTLYYYGGTCGAYGTDRPKDVL